MRVTKAIDLKNKMADSKTGKPVSAIVKRKKGPSNGKARPMLSVTEENDYIFEGNAGITERESSDNSEQNLDAIPDPSLLSKQYGSSGDTQKLTVSPSKVLFKNASSLVERNRTLSAQVPKPGERSGIQRASSGTVGMKNKLAIENPSWQIKMDSSRNLQIDLPDAT